MNNLILVIDDNPQNLQFLGNLLVENNYIPAVAQSGKKGLNFLTRKLPDLILLDIMLPEMDGYEICKRIKENPTTRHIPIIFLTAKVEPKDIVKGFEVGAVDYVTKPFNSAELLARIKTHIEMKILRGLIPICSKCKKTRSDNGYWKSIEDFIETHSEASFSHGLCPDCEQKLYGDENWYKKLKQKNLK